MSHPIDSRFLVRPLEAVYFGRPQSFFAGEAHHSQGQFPPSCHAFQGMVRSQLLRMARPALDLNDTSKGAKAERAALVGEPASLPADWQLAGPYPARLLRDGEGQLRTEPWFPVPRLLLAHARGVCRARPVASPQAALNDLGESTLLGRPEWAAKPLQGWIGPAELAYALTGRGAWPAEPAYQSDRPPFVHEEDRPGLARDGATARHGMLYFLNTLRFHQAGGLPCGLLGWLRGGLAERIPADALEDSLGAAGRKEKPAEFMAAPAFVPAFADLLGGRHLPDAVGEGDRFWLITLTPVALADPARPLERLGEVRIRTLGMLSGTPLTLGGYSLASKASRPNRRFLPAGTCWLFRLEGGDARSRAAVLRQLNDAHLLGDRNLAGFGFGHTLVGLGPQHEEIQP